MQPVQNNNKEVEHAGRVRSLMSGPMTGTISNMQHPTPSSTCPSTSDTATISANCSCPSGKTKTTVEGMPKKYYCME